MPLTEENRQSIWKASTPARRPAPIPVVTPESLHKAVDEFQAALANRWSYRYANRADFETTIAAVRKLIDAGISTNDFGIELQKIIALGMDGHAGVSGYKLPPGGCLPFLVEPSGDRFVAFNPDRTGFLSDGFPYLTKIDGRPIDDWCVAASVLVPKGSAQYVRQHALRHLRDLDYLRGLMRLPTTDTVEVELTTADKDTLKTLVLPVAKQPSTYGRWPRHGSRLLESNVGYLRLGEMDDKAVQEIKAWMTKFRDTTGLVVDVRDNGGGSRDALLQIYSYLASPDDPPHVFTAAAYRLCTSHRDDHLVKRYMYRADAKQWNESERRAVAEFATRFKPEWELPQGQFSDWHYMALSRLDDKDVYHYSKPVVVLMNAKCFSATDIFLAGLKGIRNVTLVGTPSGGGSALVQVVPLGKTPFQLRVGSMASFQADGKRFDGNGVLPDIIVEPVAEYYIGGRDNVLDEAVKWTKER